ncbi:DUF4913 domain-containing protein [Naasia lichenicola]|uniref:DUF4913 domain-containing protein n=1 Tax=Naasia lichenicola TaxID=2565933 RepID=A0A4S4FGZ6_9MICO|nr:DUF4913 domain-containing protein [Naasia lichenicola]THG29288.1 DUF4913 domain-containing protein [Naasia lichenicola]
MTDEDLDDWRDVEPTDQAEAATAGQMVFASVDDFVAERLRYMYARRVGPQNVAQHRWAADWWNYPEAVSRLEALWRSWEHLRLDGPLGMSTWWRDHADYHMAVLLSPEGPFAKSMDRNEGTESLPHRPRPVEVG